jgi:hypothetical protein
MKFWTILGRSILAVFLPRKKGAGLSPYPSFQLDALLQVQDSRLLLFSEAVNNAEGKGAAVLDL